MIDLSGLWKGIHNETPAPMQVKSPVSSVMAAFALVGRLLPLVLFVVSHPRAANAEAVSFKCEYTGYFYISFDIKTGHVIEETLSGRGLKGDINSVVDDMIYFHVKEGGQTDYQLVLNLKTGHLRSLAVPGEPSYAERSFPCVRTELRFALSWYADLCPD